VYRMIQKKKLVFWELIISAIKKKKGVHIHSRLLRLVTEIPLFESTKKKSNVNSNK
jgi:hypothetical protein